MVILLRETSDLLGAAEEVLGLKGGFLFPPHLPLALAGDLSTPHSVQLTPFSRCSPFPQDPQEVLLPSSSEPPREVLEQGEPGVRSAPRQPLSLSVPRLGRGH